MDMPFTFLDRGVTLTYFDRDPVQVELTLGDELEDRIDRAVGHYDLPRTLEEDVENLRMLLGKDQADALLARAKPLDRLAVLELLSYTVRLCREEQLKKLTALAEG